LANADGVALALPALCELVWLLSQSYRIPSAEIAEAIRRLMNAANVVMNRQPVEAVLAMLDGGGDFADRIIAQRAKLTWRRDLRLVRQTAVKLSGSAGESVRLLS